MKKSRRSCKKYTALNTSYNTKARRSYIETDYINGIRNEDGVKVIRALTDDEKEWLNKFYEETINASFKRSGTDLFEGEKDRKDLYHNNYIRNSDLYNISHITGNLEYLEDIIPKNYPSSYLGYINSDDMQDTLLYQNMIKEFILHFDIKHGKVKNTKESVFFFYKEWEDEKNSFLKMEFNEFIDIFDIYCKHEAPRTFYRLNINTKVGVDGEYRKN